LLKKAKKEGIGKSRGDVVVTMDGDFSHNPNDLVKLLDAAKDYDIVIGSRFVEGGQTTDNKHRKIVSKVFRSFASFALNLRVKDNMSGFAAIRREVYDNVTLNPIGYKINLEIMYKGKKRGFRIKEVPIAFRKRKAGKSNAGLKEALRIMKLIFRLKFGDN
jgi:dolichol-phosphate mannosyltransferase